MNPDFRSGLVSLCIGSKSQAHLLFCFLFACAGSAPAQTNPALSLTWTNGLPNIAVTGPAGTLCQVQSISNISGSASWRARTNLSLSYLPSVAVDAEAGSAIQQFYRAQVMPHATNYQATWASVNQHTPAPEWYQDAKFGIYFHWGVFSVPAFEDEWYPCNMYNTGDGAYAHHLATFGNPFSNSPSQFFPYNYFITGHTNLAGTNIQFAPVLKSQGGKWDPDAWAHLFVDAGARFAGPVAEHHDGFSSWNSSVNEWNSFAQGPHQDLAAIWARAFRAKGLKFLMAMHHAFHFNGYYEFVPAQADPSLQKLYGQLGTAAENQLWYDKLREIIDYYQPDIIYHDFALNSVQETQRLNFLSYYFNRALDWNREVVTTFKDGFNTNGEVYDYERGGPGDLQYPYWQTDDSISSSSWCYTAGIGYYGTNAVLDALIDRVSKNGNMLLNIAPMADGTIPQGQQNILLGIGDWLGKFGESIYATRAWSAYGEGPTAMGGGSFTSPTAGTATDIRFTRNKATNALYAVAMGWPGNGAQLKITTLNSLRIDLSTLTNVSLILNNNSYLGLTSAQDTNGLNVTMPASQPFTAIAYAFKLSFSGTIPALVPLSK